MRRTTQVILTVFFAAILVISATNAVNAATRGAGDPRYDGQRLAEITGLRVTNGARRVVATVRFARYSPREVDTWIAIEIPGKSRWYAAGVTTNRRTTLVSIDGDGSEAVKQHCPGLRARVQHRPLRLRVSVPQSCLPDSSSVRVSALVERNLVDLDWTRKVLVPQG